MLSIIPEYIMNEVRSDISQKIEAINKFGKLPTQKPFE